MLIELTQRQIGAAGTPVAVNTDLIQRVEPAGDAGCTLHMQGGQRVDVLQTLDDVLDRHDEIHDDDGRKHRASERHKARRERDEAKDRQVRESEAAAARDHAARLDAESQRGLLVALAAAERARAAARAAGQPERVVTSNVLPSGIDEKHPAPQPHQTQPPGAPPPAAPEAPEEDAPKDAKAAQAEKDRGPGGAFKDKAQQGKGAKSDKV